MDNETRLAAIKATEAEIRAKKAVFRDPSKQPPSTWRYRDLCALKWRATVLYATTAMMRGKLHFSNSTSEKSKLEAQQEFVESNLPIVLEWMLQVDLEGQRLVTFP